jgi:two-component system, NtrC family, nitrogen regulation sensor histidine kinase NtrY
VSLRQKLLLLFSLTVAAAVAAVGWTVLVRIRQVFERRDMEETALFVSQFQREFQHKSAEVAAAVDGIAEQERVRSMAFEMVQSGDAAPFLNEAQTLAKDARLDFLEIVGPDGNIVSSAQWPARFGYPEPAAGEITQTPFLKREDMPDGSSVLGLFAVRAVRSAEPAVKLVGGERLDQSFLNDLPVAPGMQVGLYSDHESGAQNEAGSPPVSFDARRLIGADGVVPGAERYKELVEQARKTGQQVSGILYLTARREDSVSATAIPLKNSAGNVLAVLTVAISRSGLVAEQQQIRAIAYGVASGGILLAIVFSLWIAARVSRPVEELARAAEEVASGSWDARVPVRGRDEVAVLARSFNHMTEELENQRERLVQSERVAAWRELARRLAHELKNPLFPLQLTVENLSRARQLPAAEFDEVFNESTQTLSMEIGNLKKIIGRFSDFSKMPKPELERIDARDVVGRVRSLYAASSEDGPKVEIATDVEDAPMPLMADPELMHRALSNLVLNAKDAMPEGGRVTISARNRDINVEIRVADTGQGLTPEECERLFTPYYTTKQHGTGLGLAIVQSVVTDHAGTIAVESGEGRGATFVITLPRAEG